MKNRRRLIETGPIVFTFFIFTTQLHAANHAAVLSGSPDDSANPNQKAAHAQGPEKNKIISVGSRKDAEDFSIIVRAKKDGTLEMSASSLNPDFQGFRQKITVDEWFRATQQGFRTLSRLGKFGRFEATLDKRLTDLKNRIESQDHIDIDSSKPAGGGDSLILQLQLWLKIANQYNELAERTEEKTFKGAFELMAKKFRERAGGVIEDLYEKALPDLMNEGR